MSSHHDPYVQGYTHPTMDVNRGLQYREVELIPKSILSWDCRLKLACTNPELVVIAHQQRAVNTFSPLAHTARQISKVGGTQSLTFRRTKVNPAMRVKS
jgi:hypothetical protein